MMALFAVTILSVAIAAVMGGVAWRVVREERRRSEARVQLLAADIHDVHDERASPVPVSDRFLAEAQTHNPSPLLRALAVGAVVVGTTVGACVLVTGGPSGSAGAPVAEPPSVSSFELLELAALEHERQGDRLIVRGTVRDRRAAGAHDPVTAIVSVLDREGRVVTTGQGPVENAAGPRETGVESRFVVTIPGVGEIDRYRVRFSRDDRTLAHVDKRAQTATAQLP